MPKKDILNLDKDERVVVEIKRHPIGLVAIFLTTLILSILSLSALYIGVTYDDLLHIERFNGILIILGVVLILFIALFGFLAEYVYAKNELIVTNESIIQILQFSILNRQVSQLNLAKIQDVSTDQAGIFANIFKYGTITIETAGEASNFSFSFTPHPHKFAKIIIEAHEDYVSSSGKKTADF